MPGWLNGKSPYSEDGIWAHRLGVNDPCAIEISSNYKIVSVFILIMKCQTFHTQIRGFVRRLRSPRSQSTRNGQLVLMLIIAIYMYTVLLKKKVEKFVKLDTRIVRNADGDLSPHESSLLVIQSTSSTTRLISKKNTIDRPVRKVKRLKDLANNDDPFNRQGLKRDKNAIKLAERNPIESEGRIVRAKLGRSLEHATGNEPVIVVWKAMEYQMKNYKDHFEFITPPECGSCRITANRAFASECVALIHFNSPDLRKFMDLPDPRTR